MFSGFLKVILALLKCVCQALLMLHTIWKHRFPNLTHTLHDILLWDGMWGCSTRLIYCATRQQPSCPYLRAVIDCVYQPLKLYLKSIFFDLCFGCFVRLNCDSPCDDLCCCSLQAPWSSLPLPWWNEHVPNFLSRRCQTVLDTFNLKVETSRWTVSFHFFNFSYHITPPHLLHCSQQTLRRRWQVLKWALRPASVRQDTWELWIGQTHHSSLGSHSLYPSPANIQWDPLISLLNQHLLEPLAISPQTSRWLESLPCWRSWSWTCLKSTSICPIIPVKLECTIFDLLS